ncbi:type I-E CRISPR-associated protein Cse1/CasA [Enterobacter kobei]|uniref:type I-E CRISPR-associated protein Cse1/CasA n=1 Tax=Enterobacter kobei TaxID=208224 RepID=UPI000EF199CB|nr:type I-E CRISPR-associated protein Cse1/CasA [Enterobacter kobei]AYL07663.1 type I-E CRISPR-associated protein Cse1/CasA [Enterobacter kobei]MDD9220015.1 type I-E CRISPR-associated protein Cse1/CasA [Enterobacter kobei]QIP21449.1 type I-E CRISPR-associated protein Cse1/CasA [Enterobacter kobei]
MVWSLLSTKWLPVRFKDGSTGKFAPADLADENVIDIAATRPDLQGAAWQFLLGLLQSSLAPNNRESWEDIWEEGLKPEALQKAFAPLEAAFQFGSESPSFMQDFDALDGEKIAIASLLPEIPGAQTLRLNKDLFIKRNVTRRFCPHCAALALFSLQLNAPSGGKGYRTGLRGGGPLTTLIELQSYRGERQTPLWRKLWLNVMPQLESGLPLPTQYDDAIFPWLAPTRTSERASALVTEDRANKLQAYWGMPRRIRLDFSAVQSGYCDLCLAPNDELLHSMTVKNYGVNYAGWVHPLTPYRLALKGDAEKYSVKPQPGGLIWRDWLGLSQHIAGESNNEFPAQVVSLFPLYRPAHAVTGMWGFGFDFDNMKARCWYEHHLPLLLNAEIKPHLRQAVQTASRILNLLRSALKEAWFSDARGDFSFIDSDFWNQTQGKFLQFISEIEDVTDHDDVQREWRVMLWRYARDDFDRRVFTNPQEGVDLERCMSARKKYFTSLSGR